MLLPETLGEVAAGRNPRLIILAEFDFPDGTGRYFLGGSGRLLIDGSEWVGDGGLTTVSAIGFGHDDAADMVEFGLSGVSPEVLSLARASGSVRGRDVTIYGQFLNDDHQPLDAKWVLKQLVMDSIGYGAQGPGQRSVSLTAETIWTNRNTAALAWYTDRDQQARFAGDRGCEFVPTLRHKKTPWPVYS